MAFQSQVEGIHSAKHAHRAARGRLVLSILAFLSLMLLACAGETAKAAKESLYKVEPIAGSSVSKVTLADSAAKRIAIKIGPLTELSIARGAGPASLRTVVPYSAVIYDLTGATWVYTNPEAMVYIRQPVTVDFVQAGTAVLHTSPPLNTQVVVVGTAELYGVETGVGK